MRTRVQWRQRQRNCGGDAEGTIEQLQGTGKRVLFLLYDNFGAIESVVRPCEVCAKPAELGLNENSPHRIHTANDVNCHYKISKKMSCRLACDSRNLTNCAGDGMYFVPG